MREGVTDEVIFYSVVQTNRLLHVVRNDDKKVADYFTALVLLFKQGYLQNRHYSLKLGQSI